MFTIVIAHILLSADNFKDHLLLYVFD